MHTEYREIRLGSYFVVKEKMNLKKWNRFLYKQKVYNVNAQYVKRKILCQLI